MRVVAALTLFILLYPTRSFAPGAESCPQSNTCVDAGFSIINCTMDSQCSACDPPQTGGPDCSGGFCPIYCGEYLNQTDCDASAMGCTWDGTQTTYSNDCCVSSASSSASEVPTHLFGWLALALGAVAGALYYFRRNPTTS